MSNILSQSPETQSSSFGCVGVSVYLFAATMAGILGWNIRGNHIMQEMEKDPVPLIKRLSLDAQGKIVEYLKDHPENKSKSAQE